MAALAIVLSLVLALVIGLRVDVVARQAGALVSVLLEPRAAPKKKPPPLSPPKRFAAKSGGAKGDPSPRNLRNEATPVFAPRITPIIEPPPVVTATQPALGTASQSGASDRAGPGQGAGGFGNGTGGGGNGGDGEGDGGVAKTARQIKGRLSPKDLPDALIPPNVWWHVGVRYTINIDGSVSDCLPERPSGIPDLDEMTCRLIQQRFRYRPARDRHGNPVREIVHETHHWQDRKKVEDLAY